jgi:hypothetical protein
LRRWALLTIIRAKAMIINLIGRARILRYFG